MRMTTLVAVTSAILLGAVAAQAEPWIDGGVDSDGDGSLSHAELTKASPILSASFNAMDVDKDPKVARSEFRSWHEALKVRLVAE